MDGRRDTSRDGWRNTLEYVVLTRFGPLWALVQRNERLRAKVNKTLVNSLVYKIPIRPYPFSTKAPYTSWDSLTDRSYSGLHLPPLHWRPLTTTPAVGADLTSGDRFEANLPPVEELAVLFRATGPTRYSPRSSLLFPYFVQWFTDGFLRTDRRDPLKNASNHHIDLCTVYGLNPSVTSQLRSHEGGRLKSQVVHGEEYPPFYYDPSGAPKEEFDAVPQLRTDDEDPERYGADRKATLFAMGVEVDRSNIQVGYVMLNVLCLREHNRLCRLLAESYPSWDDERLFQTARNIVIVEVMKIVIEDYINHIAPYHFRFSTDPASFTAERWYRQNWMTVEFSLVYRWHSMLPDTFVHAGARMRMQDSMWHNELLTGHGLGPLFEESSGQPAAQLGLFNTPEFLVPVELASVRLGRAARLRSYNDYRELLEFPRVTAFDQISSDDRVRKELERLYGHVDNLELYVGLYAEDRRRNAALPPMVGRLVGIDAFSQALTNPLLAESVFHPETFSPVGWEEIRSLHSLSDLVHRNVPGGRRYRVDFGARPNPA